MLNTFVVWLMENWDLIVEIFMWGMSLLMVFVLVAKVYKIVKFEFETVDAVGLLFGAVWIFSIIFFGFNHIKIVLQSFL
jgi:hypothetical protein